MSQQSSVIRKAVNLGLAKNRPTLKMRRLVLPSLMDHHSTHQPKTKIVLIADSSMLSEMQTYGT